MNWDIFISHASEDKVRVARPLKEYLEDYGWRVWLDESELKIGDSLREKIDDGLSYSRFGVVILSKNFFAKNWAKAELNALITREYAEKKVILPIWHHLEVENVQKYSPLLSDKIAVSTKKGLREVANQIEKTIIAYDPSLKPDKHKIIYLKFKAKEILNRETDYRFAYSYPNKGFDPRVIRDTFPIEPHYVKLIKGTTNVNRA